MKYLIALLTLTCFFFVSAVQAESYWVEVAAYGEKVADDYFEAAGLEDVVLHLDHNLIYRYYIKALPGKNAAESAKSTAMEKGFKYAKVVDMDEMRKKCNLACNLDDQPVIEVLHFDYDKSLLRADARRKLDEISTVLQVIPDLEVKINGHTDAHGTDNYNDALSRKRAREARQYLLAQNISTKKVELTPFGEQMPIAINQLHGGQDAPEGRQYNRRVELIITRAGQAITYEEVRRILQARIPYQLRYSALQNW